MLDDLGSGQTPRGEINLFLSFLNQRVDNGLPKRLFPNPSMPCSSVVEQVTVNHLVVGSNPTGAAILFSVRQIGGFFVLRQPSI